VANRRVTELPAISFVEISDNDLLMVVDVAEVDPGLKNKKFTFANTKDYLNQYYLQLAGGTIAGSLVVSNSLTVSGVFNPQNIQVSGVGTFANIVVTGNAEVQTTLSGNTITGTSLLGVNVNAVNFYGITGKWCIYHSAFRCSCHWRYHKSI